MKIGPKYKIARRLGAPVFEKTQTPKYALSLARKERAGRVSGRPKSEFGQALIEKQKARFTYSLGEKQFRSYVDKALRTSNPVQKLFTLLETRLDNILFRAGLARSRSAGRQMASHGHALVNGRRVTIPSVLLKEGDVVTIRAGSSQSVLFAEVIERMKSQNPPAWLKIEPEGATAGSTFKGPMVQVTGTPVYAPAEHVFDLGVVMGFYNR